MKRSFADILAGLDGDRAHKLVRKLPEWAAAGVEIPTALSLEQCSSTLTARYKAELIANLAPRSGQLPPEVSSGAACPVQDLSEAKAPSGAATECQQDFPKEVAATQSPGKAGYAPFIGGSAKRWGFGLSNPPVRSILDLTGGLGVDSWAFAHVAERVVYYERDPELAAAAERNFARLGADRIEVRCETVTPETGLPEADLIYADPARRDAAGRKVFLLEDCTPDILTLLPMLLQKAPAVLLKLSPMADLAMLAERLGPALREIHVVEAGGEVKELLCLLSAELLSAGQVPRPGKEIVLASLRKCPPGASCPAENASILRIQAEDERNAKVVYATGVQPGEVLLEPCPALLKAGAFRLPCGRWSLRKLAPSSHFYLLPGAIDASSAPCVPKNNVPGAKKAPSAPGDGLPEEAAPWFKPWRVRDVLPFGAAAFKELRQRFPQAEITARNLPLRSDALRKKMGIAPGGDTHIFGCRLADGSAVLLVCEPIF